MMNQTKSSVLFFFFIATCFSSILAQKDKNAKPPLSSAPSPVVAPQANDWKSQEIALQKQIYQRSLKYGDPVAMKSALYTLITLDSTSGGVHYKDSLLNLFYASQGYVSAVLLGRELNKENAKNETTLAILAMSEQNLGLGIEALDHFKQLYTLTQNPADLYQAATIEFKLQRLLECNNSLEQILANPGSDKEKIYIAYNEKQGQDVPLKAAVYNIKGFISNSLNKIEEAKGFYKQALAIFPEFELVKNNLESLNNPKPQGGGK